MCRASGFDLRWVSLVYSTALRISGSKGHENAINPRMRAAHPGPNQF